MKTVVVLAVAVIANSTANICLSKGMKQYGAAEPLGWAWLVNTGFHVVSNGWLVLGVVLLLTFFAAYLTALSWADLSFVLPATAPGYLLNAGLSRVFLHETISPSRWAGTILIVTGTWLVARTYTTSPSGSTSLSQLNPDQEMAELSMAGELRESSAEPTAGISSRSAS